MVLCTENLEHPTRPQRAIASNKEFLTSIRKISFSKLKAKISAFTFETMIQEVLERQIRLLYIMIDSIRIA